MDTKVQVLNFSFLLTRVRNCFAQIMTIEPMDINDVLIFVIITHVA